MPCLFSNNGVAQLNAVMSVKVAQPAGPELTGSDIRSTVLPVFEVTQCHCFQQEVPANLF